MKVINKKIVITILVILEICSMYLMYKSYNNKSILDNKIETKEKEQLAIKVINDNGEYESSNTFPGRGYVLNNELTKCYDQEGKIVESPKLVSNGESITLTSNKTLYCTLYYYLPENREYDYTGDYQVFIAPMTGNYQIELWGSSGENVSEYFGGKGAYTKGTIKLNKGETLYVYVGATSTDKIEFNGGKVGINQYIYGAAGGGGATDIRLTNGEWNNFDSLKSRIMVAAGGGGANNRNIIETENYYYGAGNGGYGGALIGGDGESLDSTHTNPTTGNSWGWFINHGGTQTSGGIAIGYGNSSQDWVVNSGRFGYSESGSCQSGGGGGYYAGACLSHCGGGGGSSFISGYTGCVAIKEESTENNIQPKDNCTDGTNNIECSYHFSERIFTDTQMIAGNTSMPSPNGGNETGHTGNGYAKITFVE